nr:DNA-directed DNA polymerase [Tanacetum cinerariifolium]
LELATRSIAYPAGIAEDVFVQVDKFTFPADFVVVHYDVDPQSDVEIIDPILKKFTNEPAIYYSPPPGDDDDDLFDLKIAPDYEDSRARSFVHRLLELQSLTCLNMGI